MTLALREQDMKKFMDQVVQWPMGGDSVDFVVVVNEGENPCIAMSHVCRLNFVMNNVT